MASPGAIVTLQLGRFANFVGAHYWNFQDETLGYLSDGELQAAAAEVLAGKIFTHGVRPRPRMIAVDFRGFLGGVRLQAPDAQPVTGPSALWDGPVQVIQADRVPRSKFYDLLCEEEDGEYGMAVDGEEDDEAERKAAEAADELRAAAEALDDGAGPQYITDFLKVEVPPGSCVQLPDLWRTDAATSGFGDLLSDDGCKRQVLEESEDKLRWFAEEADVLEGLQLLSDDSCMWAGAAAVIAAHVRDEYPKQSLLVFGCRQPRQQPPDAESAAFAQLQSDLTVALAAAQLGESASLVVPVTTPASASALPHLLYDINKPYHMAALQAAVIDSATLCFRLHPSGGRSAAPQPGFDPLASPVRAYGPPSAGATSMADLCGVLGRPAANFAALGAAVPAAAPPRRSAAADAAALAADARLSARERRLKAAAHVDDEATSDLVANGLSWFVSGWNPSRGLLAESVSLRGPRQQRAAVSCAAAMDCLHSSLAAEGIRAPRQCCVAAMPLPVPLTFPRLFAPGLTSSGDFEDARGASNVAFESNGAAHASVGKQATAAGKRGGAARPAPGAPPKTCPVLTRFAASAGFEHVLAAQAKTLQQGLYSAGGKDCYSRWGLEGQDVLECREALLDKMKTYHQFDSMSESDDER